MIERNRNAGKKSKQAQMRWKHTYDTVMLLKPELATLLPGPLDVGNKVAKSVSTSTTPSQTAPTMANDVGEDLDIFGNPKLAPAKNSRWK